MKRNAKGELAALGTMALLGSFIILPHYAPHWLAQLPFKVPFITKESDEEYKPIGKLILDGDYELNGDWMMHANGGDGSMTGFTLSKNKKQMYEEVLPVVTRLKPVPLSGTAYGDYLNDIDNDGSPDLIVEEYSSGASNETGEQYTYAMYSFTPDGIKRYPAWTFDMPATFKDTDKDGIFEMICKDTTFRSFHNDKHIGDSHDVICTWSGDGFVFSDGGMKDKKLTKAQMDKLVADVSSKIVRYDTTTSDGHPQKRVEIHPNAWAPIVELMYHGNADQAHKLLQSVWSNEETAVFDEDPNTLVTREDFWKQLWKQIDSSTYSTSIHNLNGVSLSSQS